MPINADLSSRVLQTLKKKSPRVVVFSIEEAFLGLTGIVIIALKIDLLLRPNCDAINLAKKGLNKLFHGVVSAKAVVGQIFIIKQRNLAKVFNPLGGNKTPMKFTG